ncbi:MAG: phosphate acyltransferase PlsX [Planctomycetaceae bacterium]
MRIALDAMGGDDAPGPNVRGALAALTANRELEVALVGDPDRLESVLAEENVTEDRLSVVASHGVVAMDEKPTQALRQKPECSIAVCWKLMASGGADAVVSAGNTGAVVAAGLRTRLFLPGVKRPGIAVSLPTMRGRSVLVDVGANPAARPEHLFQYGVMGRVYSRAMVGVEEPRIGLMNIGSEDVKGNDLYRETHRLLAHSGLKPHYVGNVEGRGLYQGQADVLVCEGFVGNVVLKVSEGMAEFMMRTVADEVLGNLDVERERATKAFADLARRYQYREAGGAPLLGIDGICIICHGSSDDRSIANALAVAATFKDRDINSQIVSELSRG